MPFPTDLQQILSAVDTLDPVAYARSRNFIDGAVTRLSPYISRGVISTQYVMRRTLERGYKPAQIQKFLQELAWRDYFQRVAMSHRDLMEKDILRPQPRRAQQGMPAAVAAAVTGIQGIDEAVRELVDTGYMHNHCRMYTAAIVCNIGHYGWETAARWMYYHLLDADYASNTCSWQWVAGAFSRKLYFANQENINRYCHTNQHHTFLDNDYPVIENMEVPATLRATDTPTLTTQLPQTSFPTLDPAKPTLIYNAYNLDPLWRKEENANRILLLEPDHFDKYPVCKRTLQFILDLGCNIPDLQLFVGSFQQLQAATTPQNIHYREHPLFDHYQGTRDDRHWMFPDITAPHGGFFGFWKKCERRLAKDF